MAQANRRLEVVREEETEPIVITRSLRERQPAFQAYRILRFAFVIAPLAAGIDKFFHFLVNWDMYLSPTVSRLLPIAPHSFMEIVGAVEIIAGLLVAFAPRIGGYVVMVWLWGIVLNLLSIPGYFDIALRDFGLSLGALALARLSEQFAVSDHRLFTE
jgi:hypothetical protein